MFVELTNEKYLLWHMGVFVKNANEFNFFPFLCLRGLADSLLLGDKRAFMKEPVIPTVKRAWCNLKAWSD